MKKVLAWAVALALVLSSFTMAFAADTKTSKDFKDASSIQYTEAVDVMVATGIINGYPDGTFGPQKTVKRSEMAKMISVMLEAGEDIGDQYKSACPFADSKSHWAAGYIAYCSAEHIIDGRSADVFDPEAEVTGTEVAKMALTSLGYDSKIQGYTGDQWAAAVLKDAKKNKLFNGLDSSFVPGDPCSREAAAQILFNALQAGTVFYNTNISMTSEDGTNVTVNSAAVKTGETLYEDVFGEDLVKEGTTDSYGRPSHTWEYNDEEVGTYEDEADETFVTEKEFTSIEAAIQDYNKNYTVLAETTETIVDPEDPENPQEVTVSGAPIYVNGSDQYDGTIPAGTTIELTKDGKTVTYVVAYFYVLEQIDTVVTDVSAADAEEGISAYVTIDDTDINDTDLPGYAADTYVEDAYVAVAWNLAAAESDNSDAVLDSYIPEKVTGEWTKTSKDSIYIDGKAYVTSTANKEAPFVVDGAAVGDEKDDLYLDKNGIAIGVVLVEPGDDDTFYGMLIKVGEKTGVYDGEGSTLVTIFTTDGEEAEFTVDSDVYADKAAVETIKGLSPVVIGTGADAKTVALGLISYTKNEDGEINLITPAELTLDGAKMKNGLLDKKVVSDQVAVFAYDEDNEAWTLKGKDALEDATVNGSYFATDDGIVALYAEGLIESTSTELGFFVDATKYDVKEGKAYYDVTLFVDGAKAEYETIEGVDLTGLTVPASGLPDLAVGTLVKITKGADGITKIENANVTPGAPVETFTGVDGKTYAATFSEVKAYGNAGVSFDETNYEALTSNAVIYKLSVDKDNNKTINTYSGKINAGNFVKLYQLSTDDQAWNVVVYVTSDIPCGEV